jgi:hypothetical protein
MRILILSQHTFLFLAHYIVSQYEDDSDSIMALIFVIQTISLSLLLISKSLFQLYLSYYLI